MENTVEVKPGYELYKINNGFDIKKTFYFFYMPLRRSAYEDIKQEFRDKQLPIDLNIGMLEQPKMFGWGFLGLPKEPGNFRLEGEYVAYKMIGSYKQFKPVWHKIMQDYPKLKEAYHVYKTDPTVTKEEDNLTYIIFKP